MIPSPRREHQQVGLGQRAGAGLRLNQPARHQGGDAGEADECDEQDRGQERGPVIGGKTGPGVVDARLEGQRPAHEQPGDRQRGREPPPERHEPDRPQAGDCRHGRKDQGLDRHASGGLGG